MKFRTFWILLFLVGLLFGSGLVLATRALSRQPASSFSLDPSDKLAMICPDRTFTYREFDEFTAVSLPPVGYFGNCTVIHR